MTNTQEKMLSEIFMHYGTNRQIDKLVEETGEMLQACMKVKHGISKEHVNNLAEEIADVEILLWQIKYGLCLDRRVKEQIDYKINRQIMRMKGCNV